MSPGLSISAQHPTLLARDRPKNLNWRGSERRTNGLHFQYNVSGCWTNSQDRYRFASISKRLSTRVTPATCLAFASIAAFSSALLTGPRKVTVPPEVTIFTLWAFVENELSPTTAWRTVAEICRSVSFSA